MRIEGIASYVDVAGKHHSIEGMGTLPNTPLQSVSVSGSFSFEELSCDTLKVEGECNGKSIVAKKISAEGSFDVDSVEVETFKLSGSIDAEKIVAKEILIESRGGSIGAIKCDKVKIFHGEIHEVGSSIMSKIFGGKISHRNNPHVHIKTIEAETVHLENCAVEVIKCKDAFIGSNCAIEKLFVAGECKVAPDSTVGETIRT
ncbi:MAG: hypothetical protein IJL14_07780 [Selenomonadaceae bacterium]|nr:hypothetical protein [Selenomonadaceae bacterium]MBQ6006130.1 hypothetical protein [Selenomonadaceae bacterium]